MTYKLGSKSLGNLRNVHPDLIAIVELAIRKTPVDFTVFEGCRTIERERELIAQGKSSLKDPYKCRHVPTGDGYGKAVDLVPLKDGKPTWANEDIKSLYQPMAKAVKAVAAELNVPIRWGGDWTSFKDYPHFELPAGSYP